MAVVITACASLEDYRLPNGRLDGERLYAKRCGSCHEPFAREDYGANEWIGHVEHYGPRAGLNAEARAAVLLWLCESRPAR
jgi:hypothetical protein